MSQLSLDIIVRAEEYIAGLEVVSPQIVRGGQPDEEGLRLLKQAGVNTIVNLRHHVGRSGPAAGGFFKRRGDDDEIDEEQELCEKLGLRFVNISMDGVSKPPAADIERFVSFFSEDGHCPLFVHCLYGKERTSLMVAAYRIAIEGWAADQAYQEMIRFGFDPLRTTLSDALFEFAKTKK